MCVFFSLQRPAIESAAVAWCGVFIHLGLMQHMAESVDMFVPDDIAGEARALQLAAERQLDIEKHTVRA